MSDCPKENIYGHIKRLEWIKEFISKDDLVVEFGCGTGYMIIYYLRMDTILLISIPKALNTDKIFFKGGA